MDMIEVGFAASRDPLLVRILKLPSGAVCDTFSAAQLRKELLDCARGAIAAGEPLVSTDPTGIRVGGYQLTVGQVDAALTALELRQFTVEATR